ncbi:MAG: hypothetical protein IPJ34_30785 [Myxococcales bacterium]|nr:hypothetical protein [Myxococcales bacterium]
MRPFWSLLFVTLVGCGNGCRKPEPTVASAPSASAKPSTSASVPADAMDVTARSKAVLAALKAKDVTTLASYVHPTKGVRFSPYGYIETEGGVVLKPAELTPAMTDAKKLTFGAYDGSGQPIELSLGEYWAEFVWDVDFAAGKLVLDPKEAHGNTVPNHRDVYPTGQAVELFLDGNDPEHDGMDWRALRLVFEAHEGALKLVAIVHDQWTI